MIILEGNNKEILDVTLKDILMRINNIDSYTWKLLWIESVSHKIGAPPFINGMHMLGFETFINESQTGYRLSSQELLQLSTVFDDLIEFIIIGDKDECNLQKLESDDEMKSRCKYFIELVDSSYWEITSKDSFFIDRIKKDFTYEEI